MNDIWHNKSLVERIGQVLNRRWGIPGVSSVATAVCYVMFHRNQSLVYEADSYEQLAKAINRTMVEDAVKHTIEIAQGFISL